jgi:DNA invertase Pin-like site-specific DNA recombinase
MRAAAPAKTRKYSTLLWWRWAFPRIKSILMWDIQFRPPGPVSNEQSRPAVPVTRGCVVALDRLARSMRDFSEIANTLADSDASIAFDGLIFDLATPIGQLMLTLTSTFAMFESDHFSARTQEGMARSRNAGGRPPGKQFRLDADQRRQLLPDYESREYSIRDLMRKYPIARASIYDVINRERDARCALDATASAECPDTTT